MARLVVGGVDCYVDETEVTLGHIVVPFRDLVAFGICEGTQEMLFLYDRRSDAGYRDRGAGNRAMVALELEGDVESLTVLLRARTRARNAWRGRHATVEAVLGEPPPAPIERRSLLARVDVSILVTVVLFLLGCFVITR